MPFELFTKWCAELLQHGGILMAPPYYSKRTYVIRQETLQYLDILHQCGYGTKSEIMNKAMEVYYTLSMNVADGRKEDR